MDSVPAAITRALTAHDAVTSVTLTGSRSRGDPGPLSDWDFAVAVDDFESLRADLPRLLSPLDPIRPHWDPLSRIWNLIFMLRGGAVVNLLFTGVPHVAGPSWEPSAETLQDIDTHFWDWSFWLAGKRLKGEHSLVASELPKMFAFLLSPMGCHAPPATLEEAWAAYTVTRADLARRFEIAVDERQEQEVRAALARNGVVIPT